MKKTTFSSVLATFLLCYGFWIILTWSFDAEELIAGAVVSIAVALFSARFFIHGDAFYLLHPRRIAALVAYVFVFLGELIKANTDMARRCFGGCKDVNPGIVRVPVDLESDYAEAMLANSITLTPGTMTLDIAKDDVSGQLYYYIHCIDVSGVDEQGDSIKGALEKSIRRIWK